MIIDASVAVKWLIEEPDSGTALALLGTDDLAAPALIHAEVGNAIYKKRKLGEFTDDEGLGTLPAQLASIIRTIDEVPMMSRALELALELDHPVYDCVYLAVAEALGDDLITADTRFLKKLAQRNYKGRVRALGAPT